MHFLGFLIIVLLLLGIIGALKIGFTQVVRGLEAIAEKLDNKP